MPILLVVDDDRAVRHLVRQAFEGTDIEVVEAATAEDGLDLFAANRPTRYCWTLTCPKCPAWKHFEHSTPWIRSCRLSLSRRWTPVTSRSRP